MTNKLVLVLAVSLMCVVVKAKDNNSRHKKSITHIINKTQKNFKSFITRKKYSNRIKKHILIN